MSEEEKKKYISVSEKEAAIKKKVKKRKKLAKVDVKEETKVRKIKKNLKTNNKRKEKKTPSITLVRLCKNWDECDIDKISKIISDMGNKYHLYPLMIQSIFEQALLQVVSMKLCE